MKFQEALYEKQLNIKTTGRDDSRSNDYNYPYEPTDYRVLERLARSGLIGKKNYLLDYGSGKGRVSFFLSYETGCKSIGVEYDERLYESALRNLEHYPKPFSVSFELTNAATYEVPTEVDRFFFFNPFSQEVLRSVLERIRESYYENPREMMLFFYYPSKEYVSVLMSDSLLTFEDEIDLSELFEGNGERERILVFAAQG